MVVVRLCVVLLLLFWAIECNSYASRVCSSCSSMTVGSYMMGNYNQINVQLLGADKTPLKNMLDSDVVIVLLIRRKKGT
jgi:surface polysaccharide O-acyltransferase-like enzyme